MEDRKCLRCSDVMVPGFLRDKMGLAGARVEWVPTPTKGNPGVLQQLLSPVRGHFVTTFRCGQCGVLESVAAKDPI